MSKAKEVLYAADRMAENLEDRVRDEPAVRAVLRRASGKRVEDPAVLPVHGFVARYLDRLLTSIESDDKARWWFPERDVERAFYGVAAMIAAQPRQARDRADAEDDESSPEQAPQDASPADRGTPSEEGAKQRVADPLRRHANLGTALGGAVTKNRLNADTTEARLHLLCRQSADGVHAQLPRLILYARGENVRIDWGRLTLDLSRWGADRDSVAKEWMQGYHRTIETERARREEARAQHTSTDDSEDHAA
ncbi:type I-E CRISPR-associated protein Cse2/CasB [Nocardiopsis synnemataformans]|uniref:type I-E CRISPR-associated protein Cse2/CasB n=1 Tax=Nocardiopsis synnemataformans TaxID=61305 RepID=UPI003EBB5FCF